MSQNPKALKDFNFKWHRDENVVEGLFSGGKENRQIDPSFGKGTDIYPGSYAGQKDIGRFERPTGELYGPGVDPNDMGDGNDRAHRDFANEEALDGEGREIMDLNRGFRATSIRDGEVHDGDPLGPRDGHK